jgi:Cys-rich repeat protein
LEERTFVFTPTEVPGIGAGDEVSVAPIYLSDSGKEKLGDITDTEKIGDSPPAGVGEGPSEGPSEGPAEGGTCDPVCVNPKPFCVETNSTKVCVECTDNSHCSSGYYCDSANSCTIDTILNSGNISTIWPPSAKIYFDSVDLPLLVPEWWDPINEDRYIIFDNPSESRCILIFDFIESAGIDPSDYSYIRLGVASQDLPVNIAPGDSYEIWRTGACGVIS